MPNCKIVVAPSFELAARKLAKRYSSFKTDFITLLQELEERPSSGVSLGRGVYKVRMTIKSKQRGKSGGARVITYHIVRDETLYLLTIYDKADQSDIPSKEIDRLVSLVQNQFRS